MSKYCWLQLLWNCLSKNITRIWLWSKTNNLCVSWQENGNLVTVWCYLDQWLQLNKLVLQWLVQVCAHIHLMVTK